MSNLNKVILTGNMTRDIDVRQLQNHNQTLVGSFGLASNRKFRDKQETVFVDVTVFGAVVNVLQQYTRKGSKIGIVGRLQLDTWQDKATGQNRSKLSIVADDVELLDSKGPAGPTPHQDQQQNQHVVNTPFYTGQGPQQQAPPPFPPQQPAPAPQPAPQGQAGAYAQTPEHQHNQPGVPPGYDAETIDDIPF